MRWRRNHRWFQSIFVLSSKSIFIISGSNGISNDACWHFITDAVLKMLCVCIFITDRKTEEKTYAASVMKCNQASFEMPLKPEIFFLCRLIADPIKYQAIASNVCLFVWLYLCFQCSSLIHYNNNNKQHQKTKYTTKMKIKKANKHKQTNIHWWQSLGIWLQSQYKYKCNPTRDPSPSYNFLHLLFIMELNPWWDLQSLL